MPSEDMEEETLLRTQPCVLGTSQRPRPLPAPHLQGTEVAALVAHREPRQGLGGFPASPLLFKTALPILSKTLFKEETDLPKVIQRKQQQ